MCPFVSVSANVLWIEKKNDFVSCWLDLKCAIFFYCIQTGKMWIFLGWLCSAFVAVGYLNKYRHFYAPYGNNRHLVYKQRTNCTHKKVERLLITVKLSYKTIKKLHFTTRGKFISINIHTHTSLPRIPSKINEVAENYLLFFFFNTNRKIINYKTSKINKSRSL